jgi:signal transduction histidine kinase
MRSLLRRWTSATTWWSLVLLVTGFFTGNITTVVVATGVAVVLGIAFVVPVAMVATWVLFLLGHCMATVERSRYLAYTGLLLDDPCPALGGHNVWTRFLGRLRSPGRWRELVYLLLRLPVSTVLMGLALVIWAGSAALAALPLYVDDLPGGAAEFWLFTISPGPTAWLAAVVGVALLVQLAPWATVELARVDVAFGRSLLAHGAATEIEQQVVRLESSRVAALDSAEAERRRIERDLHDGAQQRLIAAAMDLGVARERLVSDPESGRELVGHAHDEVKAALRELRDLVRGIHPVILEDRGLDAALSAVVARSPVPVELSVTAEPRPSPAVESAAYFIVCEALANVARHAEARRASVRIDVQDAVLRIDLHDDGRGGADPARGTGLSGLADRVAALGGTFAIDSPSGGPTDLRVEIPCAS